MGEGWISCGFSSAAAAADGAGAAGVFCKSKIKKGGNAK